MKKQDFIPCYLKLPFGTLDEKVVAAEGMLRSCRLCPRECKVDRTAGKQGYCRTGDEPFVSSWGPHFGEERPLVGSHGSGTIFFGNCNLGCLFCQNYEISHLGEGRKMSVDRLGEIMLELQSMGCHNINLVTPTHQMPMILRALSIAARAGLAVPLVYTAEGMNRSKQSSSWTALWTFTCRTSNMPIRQCPPNIQRPKTIPL